MPLPLRNSALDRLVDFVPNRVLKAQELELLASISAARDRYGVGSVYRDGGTLNAKIVITSDSVSLQAIDPTLAMYVFIRDRFEVLPPQIFNFTGQNTPKIYLNWKLYRVTYDDALSFASQPNGDVITRRIG